MNLYVYVRAAQNKKIVSLSIQAITDCLFFTFFKSGPSQGYCELKYEAGGIPVPEAISGPRVC